MKTRAPGEARTLDLRISLSVLTYKYDALTDCATGAYPEGRYRAKDCLGFSKGPDFRTVFFDLEGAF